MGTADSYEPQTALQVIPGIRDFMERNARKEMSEIVGSVQVTR